MAQECADALVEFGTDDVLEFAGMRVRFGIGNRKSVG
jgi:NADH/NAD ratio-sensing transcriptional regulator Rex